MTITDLPKLALLNTVIQYKGGGYDGCFWEWNFAYLDENGEFQNIFSSGYKGCDTAAELTLIIGNDDTFCYDISTERAIAEIQSECNVDNQYSLAQWIEQNTEFTLPLICDSCENETDVDEIIREGVVGCGGIATQSIEKICTECHSIGSCEHCGEYVGDDGIKSLTHREDTYGCEICLESLSRQCFDCGERETEDSPLNKQRICSDCAEQHGAPAKGAKWHSREFNGKPVFVLA